ncbi:MAG: DUF1963 domain-containing protein [Thiomargarita sp.]|nr:DUF1963 domain-containing protein [Thiomargarita sp.]
MTNKLNINLSPELETVRDKIEANLKPFIAIQAKKAAVLTVWQSKFGGLPYLPKNAEYPKDKQGNPLYLLAQINFEECPALENFPEYGILQFYIADDESYGIDFDNATDKKGFQVIYFPSITHEENNLITNFSFLPPPKYVPFATNCALNFHKKYMPISSCDYRFEQIYGKNFFDNFDDEYQVWEDYYETFPAEGHKIGGYPYFTQEDPRYSIADYDILLLQIDSDDEVDVMWGDAGVANFFIKASDLLQQDFSKVLYNWDCH